MTSESFQDYMKRVSESIERAGDRRDSTFNAQRELDYSIEFLRRNLGGAQSFLEEDDDWEYCLEVAGSSRFHFHRALEITRLFGLDSSLKKGAAELYLEFDKLKERAEERFRRFYSILFDEGEIASYGQTRELALSLVD